MRQNHTGDAPRIARTVATGCLLVVAVVALVTLQVWPPAAHHFSRSHHPGHTNRIHNCFPLFS